MREARAKPGEVASGDTVEALQVRILVSGMHPCRLLSLVRSPTSNRKTQEGDGTVVKKTSARKHFTLDDKEIDVWSQAEEKLGVMDKTADQEAHLKR